MENDNQQPEIGGSTLAFVTDIHLNFCHIKRIEAFAEDIKDSEATAVVITGDISEAPHLNRHLHELKHFLPNIPIYFVCGNHDYYHGSIVKLREHLSTEFAVGSPSGIVWMQSAGIATISPRVAIVGHDGWYDGGWSKYGNFFDSKLEMTDFSIIKELAEARWHNGKQGIFNKMQELAGEGADHIRKYLPEAFENHDKVFYLTHVSPFPETSKGPNGQISDPDWMPTFCSKLAGEALMHVMKKMPEEKKLIVLFGHSHTPASYRPLPNMFCYCGKARYGHPSVANTFSY